MPIYEYECTKCGNQTEILQKFSDAPISKCDQCSGKMKKLISHSAFHLKGTGWYVTDYANKSASNVSEKPASEKPAPEKPAPEKKAASGQGGESKPSKEESKGKKETKKAD